jgi:hypothetical protein
MAKRGPKTEHQFRYWHLRRRGASQSNIARDHDITRQAVSKSIQLVERDVMFRLLDTAQMSGILVEWYDARRGVLIGLTPQLGNLGCIIVIDGTNRPRQFYDQDGNLDDEVRKRTMAELAKTLKDALGLVVDGSTFSQVLKQLTGDD